MRQTKITSQQRWLIKTGAAWLRANQTVVTRSSLGFGDLSMCGLGMLSRQALLWWGLIWHRRLLFKLLRRAAMSDVYCYLRSRKIKIWQMEYCPRYWFAWHLQHALRNHFCIVAVVENSAFEMAMAGHVQDHYNVGLVNMCWWQELSSPQGFQLPALCAHSLVRSVQVSVTTIGQAFDQT